MATTLKQQESAPDAYPDIGSPSPLSSAAAALDPEIIWRRIESYIAHRWNEREVIWTVEGPGEWVPPLTPASVETIEVWSRANEWEPVPLDPSPFGGFYLPASGPYRFLALVGTDDPPPPSVVRAFVLLAEYMAAKGKPGVTTDRITVGSVGLSTHRSEAWRAKAMENSGAGDLLRPYRRA